jgi:hypothetical protein
MSLAMTHNYKKFFGEEYVTIATEVMKELIGAPWMSSGLLLNNAFTTALVIRVFGFMKQHKMLKSDFETPQKLWSLSTASGDASALIEKLKKPKRDATSEFVYRSLSDRTRELLESESSDQEDLTKKLLSDIRKLIQSGWIYADGRFEEATKTEGPPKLERAATYDVAEINYRLFEKEYPNLLPHLELMPLADLAETLGKCRANFGINKYPPSPAVVYWFVDGIWRADIKLTADVWEELIDFARDQFSKQQSLVVAARDSLMDPVALAMTACLCARLRKITRDGSFGSKKSQFKLLPSVGELEDGIRRSFDKMLPSGIWPKYFPMFHYEDQGAGSNYCFSFELLEAVLTEFGDEEGSRLLDENHFVDCLDRALKWCEQNRLEYPVEDKGAGGKKEFSGWNSGGYVQTLEDNQPESWATAVVHMFLYELRTVISKQIQRKIKKKYTTVEAKDLPERHQIAKMLDIALLVRGKDLMLSNVLVEYFVKPIKELVGEGGNAEDVFRHGGKLKKVSALLFGPPGTSKTEITKAVARETGWPLITITPSEFVKGAFEEVYVKVDEIFKDMIDLAGVVIFFDEMDALMQSREGDTLDTATQFLTTVMLPKLAELHDRRQAIFFMATNHQDRFDPALKRAGRFDLLLCMGPPVLADKLKKLEPFVEAKALKLQQLMEAADVIDRLSDEQMRAEIELFTFAEFGDLLERIILDFGPKGLPNVSKKDFEKLYSEFSRFVLLKLSEIDAQLLARIKKGEKLSDEDEKLAKKNWIGRYYLDRNESAIH